ncbi:hypothetical protein L1049_022379 [Liquidambar formosana]|uniref:Peptidase A1 domain-containing protein n=1 Tax=Liquidambar formosana TaxID=63359 RepID=A0AAP0RDS3_LIQFO
MNQLLYFVMLMFSSLPILSLTEPTTGGFSIELIHRDSPFSPFYNCSITPTEILTNAALRSISQANHFRLSSTDENAIESTVIPHGGDYLMKIAIGTPTVEVFAIALCAVLLENSTLFDPTKSSTYRGLSCRSKPCTDLRTHSTCGNTNECHYNYIYGDQLQQTFTMGDLATDTLIFGSTNGQAVAFPTSVFGCEGSNSKEFAGEVGLISLGGGSLSLVSQLGADIKNKFSYCLLLPFASSASKMRFGKDAIISGEGVVSTPLVPKSPSTFYYLTLKGISIREKTVAATLGEGNIIIDSGTTLTMFESSLYNNLEAVVKEAIPVEPVEAPSPFKLCYATASSEELPDIIFHFTGADLHLLPLNLFVQDNNLICLLIVPSDDSLSIFGNWA